MTSQPLALDASLNLQRKAALSSGRAFDHAGRVRIVPMDDFDMAKTIFGALPGGIARMVMKDKLAKDVYWSDDAVARIESDYQESERHQPTPPIDQGLIDFMLSECDFSMEHADGTFLQHLVFCHDYSARYFPDHSPRVALLHSILGTATNTFAMKAAKLPQLEEQLTDVEAKHVSLFPTLLRLFYNGELLPELRNNLERLERLAAIHCHRVIDNKSMVFEAEDLWVNLNYHLMHFVDFMPAANWGAHRSDPLLQQFEALSSFLDEAGLRRAKVEVVFPTSASKAEGETPTVAGWISETIPVSVKMELAKRTIRKYSKDIGHSLQYRLEWR